MKIDVGIRGDEKMEFGNAGRIRGGRIHGGRIRVKRAVGNMDLER